jgi:hypothetical protein
MPVARGLSPCKRGNAAARYGGNSESETSSLLASERASKASQNITSPEQQNLSGACSGGVCLLMRPVLALPARACPGGERALALPPAGASRGRQVLTLPAQACSGSECLLRLRLLLLQQRAYRASEGSLTRLASGRAVLPWLRVLAEAASACSASLRRQVLTLPARACSGCECCSVAAGQQFRCRDTEFAFSSEGVLRRWEAGSLGRRDFAFSSEGKIPGRREAVSLR